MVFSKAFIRAVQRASLIREANDLFRAGFKLRLNDQIMTVLERCVNKWWGMSTHVGREERVPFACAHAFPVF